MIRRAHYTTRPRHPAPPSPRPPWSGSPAGRRGGAIRRGRGGRGGGGTPRVVRRAILARPPPGTASSWTGGGRADFLIAGREAEGQWRQPPVRTAARRSLTRASRLLSGASPSPRSIVARIDVVS